MEECVRGMKKSLGSVPKATQRKVCQKRDKRKLYRIIFR